MTTNSTKMGRWFWGLLVIGSGLLLLMKAFGLGEEYSVFKIIGSIILLGIAVTSIPKFRFLMVMLPLALIVYLWRLPLGIANLNVYWLLGAAVLLGIGLSVFFRPRRFHIRSDESGSGPDGLVRERCARDEWAKSEAVLQEDELVDIDSSFGEFTRYIHATNLRKARISSNFASTKVYFDQCQVNSEGLEINVTCNFSGVILNVPRTWRLDNKISNFAGSVSDSGSSSPADAILVRLTGSVNFGEVKIVYF